MPQNNKSYLSRLDERFGFAEDLTYVSASNSTVTLADTNGQCRNFIDFMSAYGAVNFGHHNEYVERSMAEGADTVGRYYPAEAEHVANWLCARLGRESAGRVLFQVGGSHAVSAAIALAQQTRPGMVVAIRGGFHGLGIDSLAATSVQRTSAIQNTALLGALDPFIRYLDPGSFPDTWDDISCLLYEPIQGANGYVPLEPGWLRELEKEAVKTGVITIADEVQAGFYRHGTLSPARAIGLAPDIQLYSKSLTNGTFPLSAVVYDVRLEPERLQAFLAHTFQTSVMGYYAAKAVTNYIDSTPMREIVTSVNDVITPVANLLENEQIAHEVYVLGPSLSFRPSRLPAREAVQSALAQGVLIFAGGPNFERIRVAPPLTIPIDQLTMGLEALVDVLRAGNTSVQFDET